MVGTTRARRWILLGVTASVAVVGVAHVAADRRAAAGDTPPAPTDTPAPAIASQTPSISADGEFVVYAGKPTAAADTRTSTAFLQDRADNSVVELTPLVDGVRPGDTVWPVISADSCNVVVITEMAYDLFRDDDEGDRWDVYVQRLPRCGGTPGQWDLVSTTVGTGFESSAGDDTSPLFPPAISGEGALIAYTHRFSATAPDVTGVTVVDLTIPLGEPGRAQPVAGSPAEAPDSTFRYHGLREPVISDDGNVVAFTSDADNSLPLGQWGTGAQPGGFATSHVFVWDRTNLDRNTNVRRISLSPAGESGDAGSPAVSGDGRYVAFVSTAANLVPGATLPACAPDCLPQVYLYDRTDGSLDLASRAPGDPAEPPVGANLGAVQPALNRSGDEVFYVSRSTNLFPTRSSELGGPGDGDIVVSVPSLGTVQRISTLADGITPAPAVNSHPKVSANGRIVVFDTLAGAAFGAKASGGRQVASVVKAPVLTLADLDMGTVAVGYPGPEWYLVLANEGPSSFIPALTEVDNPDFLVSGGTCVDQNTTPVPPGGACTINLMFMPTVAGTAEATLSVKEYGFGSLTLTAQLTGFGGEPALAPRPGGAEAHPLVVGARDEPMAFAVDNVAFAPVRIRSVSVEGTNPFDFIVGTDDCSGRTVDAGASCNVEVVFAPTGSGRRTASVVVATTDGAYTTFLVSGDAHYEPKLAASTTTVVAPSQVTIIGAGFAPNTAVTLTWADGAGRPISVTTDAAGGLLANLVLRPNDRGGNRTVVAQTLDGEVATTDVMVIVPRPKRGANSPRFDG
jgi:Tol biopolymer transport system component